ncbi:MAG: mycothiol system anti-sigma-R factor [Bifidobacteriaceae bacterium]|nr:mycothiol system anti-sigma-R factor [Bifidobacteriaceae bacterium]
MDHLLHHWKCEEALDKLHHFLDQQLSAVETEAMLLHLEGCDSCAHEADVHSRIKDLVKRACAEVAPDHLRDLITGQIAQWRTEPSETA